MTDRERLLEQVREQELKAGKAGGKAADWAKRKRQPVGDEDVAGFWLAVIAAHHALTALALREVMYLADTARVGRGMDLEP